MKDYADIPFLHGEGGQDLVFPLLVDGIKSPADQIFEKRGNASRAIPMLPFFALSQQQYQLHCYIVAVL